MSIPKLIDVQSMVSLAVKGHITGHACSILIREKVKLSSDFLLCASAQNIGPGLLSTRRVQYHFKSGFAEYTVQK